MLLSGSSYGQQEKKASEVFSQRALVQERRLKSPLEQVVACPRCQSLNTKFCYYNNYSLTQPRHFCKNCRRYWTAGGTLRNVPVGGGCRKNKRPKHQEQQQHHTDSALSPAAAGHGGFAVNNILESCNSPVAAAGLQQHSSPFASSTTNCSLIFDNVDEPGSAAAAFEPFQHVPDMRDQSRDLEHHPFVPAAAAHIISQELRMTCMISNHSESTNSFESGIMNLGLFKSVLQPDHHPSSSMATHSSQQQAMSTGDDLTALLDTSTYMNCNNRFGTFKSALGEEEEEEDSTGLISSYTNNQPAELNASQEFKLASSRIIAPSLQIPKQEFPPWIQEEAASDTLHHEAQGSLQDFNCRLHAKGLKFLSPPPSLSLATGWSTGPDTCVQPEAAALHEQQLSASHEHHHSMSHNYETTAPDTSSYYFWSCNPSPGTWSHLDNFYTLQGSAVAAAGTILL